MLKLFYAPWRVFARASISSLEEIGGTHEFELRETARGPPSEAPAYLGDQPQGARAGVWRRTEGS